MCKLLSVKINTQRIVGQLYPKGYDTKKEHTMTYEADCTLPNELLDRQVSEQGLDFLPELIRIVINNAMQVERQKYLGIGPYERSEERQGDANGFQGYNGDHPCGADHL